MHQKAQYPREHTNLEKWKIKPLCYLFALYIQRKNNLNYCTDILNALNINYKHTSFVEKPGMITISGLQWSRESTNRRRDSSACYCTEFLHMPGAPEGEGSIPSTTYAWAEPCPTEYL